MDRGDTTQGLGNPGENVDSYFHPLPSSLFSVQTRQALEIEGKFASSTKKRQSHLANPGLYGCGIDATDEAKLTITNPIGKYITL